jgi:TfoX/Sxy family transcriptional regulator of competence genes
VQIAVINIFREYIMASDLETVQFIADQIHEKCGITFRKMFGEYCLYSHGKVVGSVSDNNLFIKPTEAGKKYIGDYVEAPPYPGAKPSLLIEDKIEDSEWLTELVVVTALELPEPKPKTRKKK